VKDICRSQIRMKSRTTAVLGLLTALLGISHGGAANLRITLGLTDTTRAAVGLRGDSARVQTRLDWLYEEPGLRPPSQRAKVEIGGNRLVVTVEDTMGAARIERLASTSGLVTFRLVAGDSLAADILDTTDGWLRKHPVAGAESLVGRVSYRRGDLRVAVRDYPLVSTALAGVDTMVYGDWRPMFGAADMGHADTLRTLYFVERGEQMSNARGWLIEHAEAHRPRGARPSGQMPKDAEPFNAPFFVSIQLSRDTFSGRNPTQKLAQVTAANVGRRLALVMDSVVITAPAIQCEIPTGRVAVMTDDTLGSYARDLTTILLNGPLYAPLVVERVERVRRDVK
jgi:hypothetical protein